LPGSLNMHNEYTEASASSRAPSIDKLRHELWMEKGGGAAAAKAAAAFMPGINLLYTTKN
jgi:hypothetical protein